MIVTTKLGPHKRGDTVFIKANSKGEDLPEEQPCKVLEEVTLVDFLKDLEDKGTPLHEFYREKFEGEKDRKYYRVSTD